MTKFKKQKFGSENPIFFHEEREIIAAVDRADESTTNSQAIGRNGEVALRNFLNRYLPPTMRVVNGHFVTPKGDLSPETDLMLIDTRYPFISENADGFVIAMIHSILSTIEVKRTLKKQDIEDIRKKSSIIDRLNSQVFKDKYKIKAISQRAFAYRSKIKINTIKNHFFNEYETNPPSTFLTALRILSSDLPCRKKVFGVSLFIDGGRPFHLTTLAPLSDFYFGLVQDAYYTLNQRKYEYGDIGEQIFNYATWGTYPNRASFNGMKES